MEEERKGVELWRGRVKDEGRRGMTLEWWMCGRTWRKGDGGSVGYGDDCTMWDNHTRL